MLFNEIPGLAEVKSTLIHAVHRRQIAHAQLFLGNEGSANLAMALAYATYINCENPQADDSCGQCPACSKINKLVHPDVHMVFPVATTKKVTKDPLSQHFLAEWRTFVRDNPYACLSDWLTLIGTENKQPNISAEESRQVIQRLSLKAFEARYKVLLLWLPECLHTTSANALLKILEEPPPFTVFLLVGQSIDQLLTTIISRTQLVKIRAFSDQEIQAELMRKLGLDEKRALQIAHLSDGDLNEAYRLSREIKNDNHALFRDWMRLCFRASFTELVEWSEKFHKMSKDSQKGLMQYGISMVREALVWPYREAQLVRLAGDELVFVEGFAKLMNPEKAETLYTHLNDACYHLERNASPKIVFLDTSLTIAGMIKS
jgi:DNA polymerase III subunit delta'